MITTSTRQSIPSPKTGYDLTPEVVNQIHKIIDMMADKGWCAEAIKPKNCKPVPLSKKQEIIECVRLNPTMAPPESPEC